MQVKHQSAVNSTSTVLPDCFKRASSPSENGCQGMIDSCGTSHVNAMNATTAANAPPWPQASSLRPSVSVSDVRPIHQQAAHSPTIMANVGTM